MAAEKNFENKIKRYLKSKGAWFVKFFANEFTKCGIPDIIGCYHGRFFAIEVKGGSNYGLTDLQRHNLKLINKAGGVGLCVYPGGFDEMVRLFETNFEGFVFDWEKENYVLK